VCVCVCVCVCLGACVCLRPRAFRVCVWGGSVRVCGCKCVRARAPYTDPPLLPTLGCNGSEPHYFNTTTTTCTPRPAFIPTPSHTLPPHFTLRILQPWGTKKGDPSSLWLVPYLLGSPCGILYKRLVKNTEVRNPACAALHDSRLSAWRPAGSEQLRHLLGGSKWNAPNKPTSYALTRRTLCS
jgi:hypothetical protein